MFSGSAEQYRALMASKALDTAASRNEGARARSALGKRFGIDEDVLALYGNKDLGALASNFSQQQQQYEYENEKNRQQLAGQVLGYQKQDYDNQMRNLYQYGIY